MEKLKEGINSKKRDNEEASAKNDKEVASQKSGELDNTSEKSGTQQDIKNSVVSKTSNNKSIDGPAAGPAAVPADQRSNNSPKANKEEKIEKNTPSTNRDASNVDKSPGRPEQQEFMRQPQIDYNQMYQNELIEGVPGMNEFEIENLDEILECGDDLMDIEQTAFMGSSKIMLKMIDNML